MMYRYVSQRPATEFIPDGSNEEILMDTLPVELWEKLRGR